MPSGQRDTTVSIPLTPTRSDLYWRRIFNKVSYLFQNSRCVRDPFLRE